MNCPEGREGSVVFGESGAEGGNRSMLVTVIIIVSDMYLQSGQDVRTYINPTSSPGLVPGEPGEQNGPQKCGLSSFMFSTIPPREIMTRIRRPKLRAGAEVDVTRVRLLERIQVLSSGGPEWRVD
jgi:hypothetical protein